MKRHLTKDTQRANKHMKDVPYHMSWGCKLKQGITTNLLQSNPTQTHIYTTPNASKDVEQQEQNLVLIVIQNGIDTLEDKFGSFSQS